MLALDMHEEMIHSMTTAMMPTRKMPRASDMAYELHGLQMHGQMALEVE